jgi:hypothetical protein
LHSEKQITRFIAIPDVTDYFSVFLKSCLEYVLYKKVVLPEGNYFPQNATCKWTEVTPSAAATVCLPASNMSLTRFITPGS